MEENGHTGTESNPMEQDPAKMFIGGLHSQSNAESLQRYFEKYGELKECVVMRDAITKRSRGFGFVRFKDVESVDKVQDDGPHIIDGKKVDPKRAIPKKPPPGQNQFRKVFVGGLPPDITPQELTEYFETFGKVTECLLMHDRNTKRLRGFGFITFENDTSGKQVCETGFHKIKGKTVECKRAQSKEAMMMQGKGRGIFAVNLSPLSLGRSFNGLTNPVCFPDWSHYPQLYQQLVNVMQLGGRGKTYAATGGNYVTTPQGFMNMPDHRNTQTNQFYPDYTSILKNSLAQSSSTETPTVHAQDFDHHNLNAMTFTQYSQPNTVLTPASSLTQGMTHPSTRQDIGILTSRSGHFNSEPQLYGTMQQSPQTAAYGTPVRFVELSRNAVLPIPLRQ